MDKVSWDRRSDRWFCELAVYKFICSCRKAVHHSSFLIEHVLCMYLLLYWFRSMNSNTNPSNKSLCLKDVFYFWIWVCLNWWLDLLVSPLGESSAPKNVQYKKAEHLQCSSNWCPISKYYLECSNKQKKQYQEQISVSFFPSEF